MYIHLTQLTCLDQQEWPGDDEIQIEITIDRNRTATFDKDMNRFSKSDWNLGFTDVYNVKEIMIVQIKERDILNDDIIGSVSILPQDKDRMTSQIVEGARAKYKLSWEFLSVPELA